MNKVELNLVIKNLKELYTREAELKEAISGQEAIVKQYLTDNKLEAVTVENGTATWKAVFSKVMDMKAFREANEALYQIFTVNKVTRRFKVA